MKIRTILFYYGWRSTKNPLIKAHETRVYTSKSYIHAALKADEQRKSFQNTITSQSGNCKIEPYTSSFIAMEDKP